MLFIASFVDLNCKEYMHQQDLNTSELIARLAEFADSVGKLGDFDGLAQFTLEFIEKHVQPDYVSITLFESSSGDLVLDKYLGCCFERSNPPAMNRCVDVAAAIAKGGEVLAAPENHSDTFIMLYDPDQIEYCELRIPFFVKDRFIGVLGLGKPRSGREYTVELIDLMRILTSHIGVQFDNLSLRQTVYVKDHVVNSENPVQDETVQVFHPYIRVKAKDDYDELLGHSSEIIRVKEMISRIAAEKVPVLITGESGTGKELVARSIHMQSRRATKPLVTMNCAAMPDNLVESELFGHEKGAFTGAIAAKKGKFEFANDSTLFLDEIGDMNLHVQAKLLRVLQDGQFQRIGSNDNTYSDVRLIAATNKNLSSAMQNGEFREDLFYRINVFQIEIPPLRERGDDILLLANNFLRMFNERYQKSVKGFDPSVVDWMQGYHFPGNVRELRNIIERAVIMGQYDIVTLNYMPNSGKNGHPKVEKKSELSLDALERDHIISVLKQVENNKSAAARILGIARKTLREKIQKYNIEI